jgi:hypothetical protein
MKKLTIGRNNACDIIIPDTSDLVSRKQAVLTYSFWGKMVIYDTSNNGTYVNGQKLENGKGLRVTRKDKINFARIADLDWNEVKDPYKRTKIISTICTVAIVVIAVLLALWLSMPNEDDILTPTKTEISSNKGETKTTIQPQTVEEQPKQQPTKKSKKKANNKKGKSVTPNDVMNKEVNDNSPIVY